MRMRHLPSRVSRQPETLSSDRGVAARVSREPGVDGDAYRRDRQQHDGVRTAEPVVSGQLAHRQVDPRREDLDTGREPDQARHLEGLQAAQDEQQQHGQQRRDSQRQHDPTRGRPPAPATHQRGFLERGVLRAERRGHDQEGQQSPVDAGDKDHPGQREDVQRHPEAGEVAPPAGDDPGPRTDQQDPADGEKDTRHDQGSQAERQEGRSQRRIRALGDPCQARADDKCHQRRAQREGQRVEESSSMTRLSA